MLTHKVISLKYDSAKGTSPLNSGILSTNGTDIDPVDGRSKYFFGETFYNRMKLVEKIKSEFSLVSGEVIAFALRSILSITPMSMLLFLLLQI